jgi:3-dehydroquinate dehydratase-1
VSAPPPARDRDRAPLLVGTVSRLEFLSGYADTAAESRAADQVEARLDLFEGTALEPTPEPTVEPTSERTPDRTSDRVFERTFDRAFERTFDRALAACQKLEATGTPVLVTIRLQAEGGRWTNSDLGRLALFERALDHVSWVDVEALSAIAADVTRAAHQKGKRAVVSHHDFTRTPPLPELQRVVEQCRRTGADVVKIATMVNAPRDRQVLIDLLAHGESLGEALCVIGMGADAAALRVLFPTLGSVFAYAYLDEAAAPGQLSAAEMVVRLSAESPLFRAHHLARTQLPAPPPAEPK